MLCGMTMDSLDAVRVRGLRKSLRRAHGARRRGPDGGAAARCSRCSAPTAPARRRWSRSSKATARPTPASVSVLGYDPGKRERGFRAQHRDRAAGGRAGPGDHGARGDRALRRRLPAPAAGARSCSSSSGSATAATYRAADLSGGQRRRLDLALGLVGDPDLIFLDEPTTGFDPAARRQSWETIANLRSLGKSILLTTHYMEEAQHLADRVVVLAKGRVVAEGTPDELGSDDADDARQLPRARLPRHAPAARGRDRRARARAASAPPRRRATWRRCSNGPPAAAWSSST